jgi:RNA polymerase sigma factor (sigma-70 family)
MNSVLEDMEFPALCRVAARIALRRCGVSGSTLDICDLDDLTQEVYVRILGSPSVEAPRRAVWKAARNLIIDILRKPRPSARHDLDELPAPSPSPYRRDPDDELGVAAAEARLDRLVRDLSAGERQVADFCLRTGEELGNNAAIAEGLGKTSNAIAARASRIRKRARAPRPGVEELEGRRGVLGRPTHRDDASGGVPEA